MCKILKFFLIFLKIGRKDIKAITLVTVKFRLKNKKRESYFLSGKPLKVKDCLFEYI